MQNTAGAELQRVHYIASQFALSDDERDILIHTVLQTWYDEIWVGRLEGDDFGAKYNLEYHVNCNKINTRESNSRKNK